MKTNSIIYSNSVYSIWTMIQIWRKSHIKSNPKGEWAHNDGEQPIQNKETKRQKQLTRTEAASATHWRSTLKETKDAAIVRTCFQFLMTIISASFVTFMEGLVAHNKNCQNTKP